MTEKQVDLMTAMYADSWPEKLVGRSRRGLMAVLRAYSWDEALEALAELRETMTTHPNGVDIVARIEAIRRNGPQSSPGKLATKAGRARGLLSARRALYVPQRAESA